MIWQLEIPDVAEPTGTRLHWRALKVPTPTVAPAKATGPRGEVTLRLGLSVSTTVAVQVVGVPITTTDWVQLREVAELLTSAAPSNGMS